VGNCTYFIAGVADPEQKWHMVDITIHQFYAAGC
jgi:hypothetical protein